MFYGLYRRGRDRTCRYVRHASRSPCAIGTRWSTCVRDPSGGDESPRVVAALDVRRPRRLRTGRRGRRRAVRSVSTLGDVTILPLEVRAEHLLAGQSRAAGAGRGSRGLAPGALDRWRPCQAGRRGSERSLPGRGPGEPRGGQAHLRPLARCRHPHHQDEGPLGRRGRGTGSTAMAISTRKMRAGRCARGDGHRASVVLVAVDAARCSKRSSDRS